MDAIPFDFTPGGIPAVIVQGQAGRGEAATVVIDTGAVGPFPVYLSEERARALGLTLSAPFEVRSSTAVGPQPQSYRTAHLAHFALGPVELRDVTVAVTPVVDGLGAAIGRKVDAVVGYTFLKERIVTIDYGRRTVDLAATDGATEEAVPFKLAPDRGLVLVSARVNGAGPFTLEIDTGASGTSLIPEAAARAHVRGKGEGRVTGAGGIVAVKVGEARIDFASLRRDLPVVSISDAIAKVGTAAGVKLDGIIGGDFLAGTRLTLDYPARRLWLAPGVPAQK